MERSGPKDASSGGAPELPDREGRSEAKGFPDYDERLGPMIKISNPKSQISNLADQHGVALLIVLWIFIFLFVVAFDFSSSVREEGMAAHRFAQETEGYYLALAGFEDGLRRFVDASSPGGQGSNPATGLSQPPEIADGSWREEKLGQGLYRVRLLDETGKINLNRVNEETLRTIFINLGIEEPRRSVLVDSILDWREAGDLHRPNGAKSDYYLSLSPSYSAKNGPFDTVEELLWVRGVTPEIFFGQSQGGDSAGEVGLKDIFTVDSPTDRVNLRTASPEVIHALTGIPLDRCRAFVEQRTKLSEKSLGDLLALLGIVQGDAVMQYFVFTNPSVVTIEAAGRPLESNMERWVKGVVRVTGGGRGFEILRWVDRDTGGAEE